MQILQSNNSWRDYQKALKKESISRKRFHIIGKYAPVLPIIIAIFIGAFFAISSFACRVSTFKTAAETKPQEVKEKFLKKKDIRELFNDTTFVNLTDKSFNFATGGEIIKVDTSIDMSLQNYLLGRLEKLHKIGRGKPRHLAIVAIEPSTGRVLCMASFDKMASEINHCTSGEFPAASLFKIVTATAAIEQLNFTPNSMLEYNGGKYTLYKSQLKNRKNKYTNKVSLKKSFAESINPVFGKIGSNMLGKDILEEYASSFGFNQEIDFELPLSKSYFEITPKPYHWAEIACGFNRDTLISPLHSALMSAAVLNEGRLPEPTIIDKIYDEKGKVIYTNLVNPYQNIISQDTSEALKSMMSSTVKNGTARKAFRGYKRDSILSKLEIGGKTGSISNKKRDVKYDWFIGFASEKNGSRQMAISVVVGHEEYLGTRAGRYARMAMKEYFKNFYITRKNNSNKKKSS